jgi:hypothetical protein
MNLLQISWIERSTLPVFIVGEARSGTSILYRTLQKHDVFRPREENLAESQVMTYVDRIGTLRSREPASMFGYMAYDESAYDSFLASIAPMRPLVGLLGVGQRFVVRSYFHHARSARGVDRILEKSPAHIRHVDGLLAYYPKAQLIYIHRHPVDVYSSYLRRAEADPNADWARISTAKFATLWEANTTLALNTAARLGDARFLLVRYEAFTAKADRVVKEICDFVRVPFDPQIVIERNPDLTRWKPDPHVYGQIAAKTKDWRTYVSIEAAMELQQRVASTMKRLSYDPYAD